MLATQQAQALSALAIVNGLTASGGVTVSKDILYGDESAQDLDVYYPKPLARDEGSTRDCPDLSYGRFCPWRLVGKW